MLQVERQKYEIGVNWLVDLLRSTEFTVERIRVCAAKMANDVAQAKRHGNSAANDLLKAMYYQLDSNVQFSSMLRQHKFLTIILEKLEKPETAQHVIDDLNKVRDIITDAKNVAIHVAANWKRLSCLPTDLATPWMRLGRNATNEINCLKVIPDYKIIKKEGVYEDSCGSIVGMGCVESAFLYQAAPAINSFMDPDLPVLLLFLQYLCQLEGPLWRQIRGQGLAYGYSMLPLPNEGLLYLTLYRATNVLAAYKEAKTITENQLKDNAEWDAALLESARSSLIFEIIEREKSVGDVVIQALLSSFKKVPIEFNRILVESVTKVTIADLVRVGKQYVAPLFSNKAKTAIVCHPDRVSDFAAGFTQLGHNLTVDTNLDESVLGKC